MKQAGWVCAAVLGTLLVVGATSEHYDMGRFNLVVLECQRDYFEFDKAFPQKSEKVSCCFKIDKDSGQVWLFKDERYALPNSSKVRVKQYFEQIPYEEVVLPRSQ